MPWLAATLEVDPAQAEALSEALLDAGAAAVSLGDPDLPRASVQALMVLDADAAAIVCAAAAACGLAATPPFTLSRVDDEDWVRRSQSQFEPLRVGGRLWVGATWHTPPAGVPALVRIDPGLAFGTGSHPTTRLVLGFLERVLRGGESVLDYGCGSGILAIAAAKLGAARVDAVDIDADAVVATAENAVANAVELRAASPEDLPPDRYDVVVSNILAQPLIVLAPLLAARTAPGGRLALAGVLSTQADEVAAAYAGNFEVDASRRDDGWTLIEGRRR